MYNALVHAHIEDDRITIDPNFRFPVENDEELGNVLLVRQAQIDLFDIFNYRVVNGNKRGLFIFGPTGVGIVSSKII